jgi:hypothetical protein
MTARKAPAPVADVTEAREARTAAKQRHPAGKTQPAAKAPAKAPAKPAVEKPAKVEQPKVTYAATARCGKTNTRSSATPLVAALDVVIGGKNNPAWSAGVIVQMYADRAKAEAAAASINAGAAGSDWTDAVVVPVVPVKAVSA